MSELIIGTSKAAPATQTDYRFTSVLWGIAGCGKTVMAATAPKPILWLQWDSDGTASLEKSDDIHIIDLSSQPPEITEQFKTHQTKAFKDIEKFLREQNIRTLVFDSCTTFGKKALEFATTNGAAYARGKEIITPENPGRTGYGIKNTLMTNCINNLLTICTRANVHLIVIAHEDLPKKDKDDHIVMQTIMVGGSLAFQIPVDFNEVWHLSDEAGQRVVSIRVRSKIKPLKTRMFDATRCYNFVWNYDQATKKGDTIEKFYNDWKENKFQKLDPNKYGKR